MQDGPADLGAPVHAAQARIECIGVNPLDLRRVDVAVDITPFLEALTVEMAIVGPDGAELSSLVVLDSRQWMLDKVMHLSREAGPGEYTLHVGLFRGAELVHSAAKTLVFALADDKGKG
jgi:hypothetical protein